MPVGISYEIAAVLVSLVIFLYFGKTRKIAVFQDDILLLLVVMNGLSASCNIMSYLFRSVWGMENVAIETLTACSMGYFATHVLVPPLMCLYILSSVRSWRDSRILLTISLALPVGAALSLIFTNPMTGYIFTHSPEGIYHREDGIIIIYGIAAYYILYLLVLMMLYHKKYSFIRKVTTFAVLLLCVLSNLIQYLFPSQTVETVMIAISALILLLFIQNPGAQVDRTTGAYSKAAFYSVMNQNCLSGKKKDLYVIMMSNLLDDNVDADYEKIDAVLVQAVKFLWSLGEKYNVYRIDKYVFCLETASLPEQHADALLDNIYERFKNPWGYLECNFYLHARIGKISMPKEVHTIEQLLGVLDQMIDSENTEDILHVEQFDLKKIEREKMISDALAKSIENRDFEMRYTPICFLKDKQIVGAEISVRFYDDKLGYVYYDEILEFAEKAGYMANLGELIFDETCRLIGEEKLDKMGLDMFCVQILPAMCLMQGLSDKLIGIMEKRKVSPSLICLQISELAVSMATDVFRENMLELSEKGVKFCLTGYGSGYTNISNIYELPFSLIKFSRSFVQSSLTNEKARITLECTLALSRELYMMTIVPGIADSDYFDMISDMSCDYAEGKYFYEQLDMAGFRHMMEDAAGHQIINGEEGLHEL